MCPSKVTMCICILEKKNHRHLFQPIVNLKLNFFVISLSQFIGCENLKYLPANFFLFQGIYISFKFLDVSSEWVQCNCSKSSQIFQIFDLVKSFKSCSDGLVHLEVSAVSYSRALLNTHFSHIILGIRFDDFCVCVTFVVEMHSG